MASLSSLAMGFIVSISAPVVDTVIVVSSFMYSWAWRFFSGRVISSEVVSVVYNNSSWNVSKSR